MASRLFIVFLLLAAYFIDTDAAATPPANCEKILKDADEAMDKILMIANANVTEYKTEEDFNEDFCIPALGWLKTYNAYKKCMKAFPRTLYAFVGTNLKKTHKEYCVSPEKRQIAFRHLRCMNPRSKHVFREAGKDLIAFSVYVANMSNVDEIIPLFCCGYNNFAAEMTERAEKACVAEGMPGSGLFIANIVKSVLQDPVDIMCGAHSKAEDCKSPRITENMNGLLKFGANKTHADFPFLSSIIPVVKILDRMDGKFTVN